MPDDARDVAEAISEGLNALGCVALGEMSEEDAARHRATIESLIEACARIPEYATTPTTIDWATVKECAQTVASGLATPEPDMMRIREAATRALSAVGLKLE